MQSCFNQSSSPGVLNNNKLPARRPLRVAQPAFELESTPCPRRSCPALASSDTALLPAHSLRQCVMAVGKGEGKEGVKYMSVVDLLAGVQKRLDRSSTGCHKQDMKAWRGDSILTSVRITFVRGTIMLWGYPDPFQYTITNRMIVRTPPS
ncbi:hypothetical protein N657DRAFT_449095 [Parathielavia appendiculata]|uniref:Uncharacterized protein n=1 Tax=Parathielavia appendiculata TaxID=2587402 RepID=A0AAN6TZ10_9PEZI|nr:hypothetical protein N657DRAFT_449095 [Parathielavia appendiculata]